MKRLQPIAFLSLFAALTSTVFAGDWQLVWSDEFNYHGLPDKTKWDYEEGFVRNNELQYYTRGRKENARVEDGMLVIEGIKETYNIPRRASTHGKPRPHADKRSVPLSDKDKPETAAYTAASLITRNKADWTFGRIEVRAKLPQGKGMWPAIWTLGANRDKTHWPACGEIDIMEFVGKEPRLVHATTHFAVNGAHKSNGGRLTTDQPWAAFHVYAIEWFNDRIDFYFDDKKYHTFPIDQAGSGPANPFRQPHYLLINLAMGGTWGGPIDDAILPQKFCIDYVRIYQNRAGK